MVKLSPGWLRGLQFIFLIHLCSALEPITGLYALGTGIAATFIAAFNPIRCRFFAECCTDRHIRLNETNLIAALDTKVYGQHLVKEAVLNHLRAHTRSENPSKALALSFHGGTGTGKNYVSKFIAESLFKKGMKSKYVHLRSATKDYPHTEMLHHYKDTLKNLIENSVKECDRSMFIFDEVDKMPEGLLDMVKPYLDFHMELQGVDYRKSVFIFLSNTAGNDILKTTMDHWHSGKKREEMKLRDIEKYITKAAVNTRGGLWHSNLLTGHMITAHLPFLPMERKHVRECIKDSLLMKKYVRNSRDIKEDIVKEIEDELVYFPEDEQLFSVTGCKRVPEKVDFVMASHA